METLRWGLVGAGSIAELAMKELGEIPGVSVTSLVSRPSGRRDDFARRHSISEVTDDLSELERLSANVFFVATPNAFHADQAAKLLRVGKHVLLDKPFAISLEEASEVREAMAVEGSGKFLLGMNLRLTPGAARLKGAVATGQLGDVYEARAVWKRREGIPQLGSWFGHKRLSGGGVLLDLGVHLLDLTFSLLGDFDCVSVSATTRSLYGPRGLGGGSWGNSSESGLAFDVEDTAQASLRMKSGRTIVLDLAWAGPFSRDDEMDVVLRGTEGAASLSSNQVVPAPGRKPSSLAVQEPLATNRFAHFCDVVCGSAEPMVTLDEALKVQAVLDAIYRSAALGAEVVLTD